MDYNKAHAQVDQLVHPIGRIIAMNNAMKNAMKNTDDRIIIFDTTLRDGEQAPGATLNVDEKITIARQLGRLGVDVIEAGFAFASPGDFEAVKRIAELVGVDDGPVICSLARALPADIKAAADALQPAVHRRIIPLFQPVIFTWSIN